MGNKNQDSDNENGYENGNKGDDEVMVSGFIIFVVRLYSFFAFTDLWR